MGNWLGKILARQTAGGGGGGTGIADQGTIYYVSPAGSGVSTSIGSPGSFASTIASGSGVSAGDTVKMRGGTYTGNFIATFSGSVSSGIDNPAGKIIVKPYQNERPILDPGSNTTLNCFTLNASSYVWWVGIEVAFSDFSGRAPGGGDDKEGIDTNSGTCVGAKLIGCTVHDTSGNNYGLFAGFQDGEINGSLGYYSGETLNGGNYAYPLYNQNNASGQRRIYKCAFLQGFGNYQIHSYSGDQHGIDVQYCTLFANVAQAIYLNYPGSPNAPNIQHNNFMGVQTATIRLHDPGTTNAVATDNWFDGDIQLNTPPGATQTNLDLSSNLIFGNIDTGNGGYPSNTFFGSTPGSDWVRVSKYDYIGKAGMVTIFKWTGGSSATVDVSSILSNGDTYEVIDMQNRFGTAISTGTLSGTTISIPLTGSTVATPVQVPQGAPSPTHTSSTRNIFLVRATPYNW